MPIYEYVCGECSRLTEALQRMSDAPLVDCPECGAPALRKKVSAAAFRLKGGGWYETDFKADGKKNLAGDAPRSEGTGGDAPKADSGKSEGSDGASKAKDSKESKAGSGSGASDTSKKAGPSAKSAA